MGRSDEGGVPKMSEQFKTQISKSQKEANWGNDQGEYQRFMIFFILAICVVVLYEYLHGIFPQCPDYVVFGRKGDYWKYE
jgi:hypothetical protein